MTQGVCRCFLETQNMHDTRHAYIAYMHLLCTCASILCPSTPAPTFPETKTGVKLEVNRPLASCEGKELYTSLIIYR